MSKSFTTSKSGPSSVYVRRPKKASVPVRIAKLERAVRKNAPEVQMYCPAPASYLSLSTTGGATAIPFNALAYNQRVGNALFIKSLKIRNTLSLHPSATASQARLIVVQYLEDGTPDITDYLQSVAVTSGRNVRHRYEFHTLYDRVHTVDIDKPKKYFEMNIKPKKPVNYLPDQTTIENQGIYFIYLSDEATNVPSWTWTPQSLFQDN